MNKFIKKISIGILSLTLCGALLTHFESNTIFAEEITSTVNIEPRTGGHWYQYRKVYIGTEMKTLHEYVDGQPYLGTYLTKGGSIGVNIGSGRKVNISFGIGGIFKHIGISVGYSNIGTGIGTISNPAPSNGYYKLVNKSTYRIEKYKLQRRSYGRGEWKTYDIELKSTPYIYKFVLEKTRN